MVDEEWVKINESRGEVMKVLWKEALDRFVEALDEGRLERAAELRAVIEKTFFSTVDDVTHLMLLLKETEQSAVAAGGS